MKHLQMLRGTPDDPKPSGNPGNRLDPAGQAPDFSPMAGVGKLLKQAQKMQKQMEAVQAALAAREIEVSSGGGAVQIVITGAQEVKSVWVDPELLKEEAELVNEALTSAFNDAVQKAKAVNDEEMAKVSQGMSIPGLM